MEGFIISGIVASCILGILDTFWRHILKANLYHFCEENTFYVMILL